MIMFTPAPNPFIRQKVIVLVIFFWKCSYKVFKQGYVTEEDIFLWATQIEYDLNIALEFLICTQG